MPDHKSDSFRQTHCFNLFSFKKTFRKFKKAQVQTHLRRFILDISKKLFLPLPKFKNFENGKTQKASDTLHLHLPRKLGNTKTKNSGHPYCIEENFFSTWKTNLLKNFGLTQNSSEWGQFQLQVAKEYIKKKNKLVLYFTIAQPRLIGP